MAARIGKTHGNLLHHFGSAAGLQGELARLIGERVTAEIARVVERERQGEADPREIVDRTFDAFDREGAGALAAWMILSGNRDALDPILDAIHRLVDRLGSGHEDRPVHETTLWLVLAALGDSLLGGADGQGARPAARPGPRDRHPPPRPDGGPKGGVNRHPGLDPGSTLFLASARKKVDAGSSPA